MAKLKLISMGTVENGKKACDSHFIYKVVGAGKKYFLLLLGNVSIFVRNNAWFSIP